MYVYGDVFWEWMPPLGHTWRYMLYMCVLFSSCTLLMRKSPLVWTRFIRDSIVCVNAIENSLLETMPAVLVLHSTTGNPGTIRNNRKHAEGCSSIRMCAHIFEIVYCILCAVHILSFGIGNKQEHQHYRTHIFRAWLKGQFILLSKVVVASSFFARDRALIFSHGEFFQCPVFRFRFCMQNMFSYAIKLLDSKSVIEFI